MTSILPTDRPYVRGLVATLDTFQAQLSVMSDDVRARLPQLPTAGAVASWGLAASDLLDGTATVPAGEPAWPT